MREQEHIPALVDVFWITALSHMLPQCEGVAVWLGRLRAVQQSDPVVMNEVHRHVR